MKSEMVKVGKRKALIFVLLFASLAFVSFGCAGETPPEEEWNRTFGGTGQEMAHSIQQTTDGGYILAGYTFSPGASYCDLWLMKTDSNGNKQWERTFGGTENDLAWSVQQTADSGYILAGYTTEACDFWLVKTDSNGNKQWDRTFSGSEGDRETAYSVQQTTDGGYILAGVKISHVNVAGSLAALWDLWVVKTDSNGKKQWDRTFGGTYVGGPWTEGLMEEMAHSVQQTTDGGYILAGYTTSYGAGGRDGWLVKTDSNGNELWNRTFGGTGQEMAHSIQQTTDGGYILAGYTGSYGDRRGDFWLVKTDSNGNELWNRTFGGTDSDWAYSVQQTTDGGYILAGYTLYVARPSDSNFWLVKTDSNGNKQWDRTFGGIYDDKAYSVQQTADGGYIIAGGTESYGAGYFDAWLIKLAGSPTPTPTPTETTTPLTITTPSPTPTPPSTPTLSPGPTATPITPEEKGIAGFEAVFAIAGLLAVAYLVWRIKK